MPRTATALPGPTDAPAPATPSKRKTGLILALRFCFMLVDFAGKVVIGPADGHLITELGIPGNSSAWRKAATSGSWPSAPSSAACSSGGSRPVTGVGPLLASPVLTLPVYLREALGYSASTPGTLMAPADLPFHRHFPDARSIARI